MLVSVLDIFKFFEDFHWLSTVSNFATPSCNAALMLTTQNCIDFVSNTLQALVSYGHGQYPISRRLHIVQHATHICVDIVSKSVQALAINSFQYFDTPSCNAKC